LFFPFSFSFSRFCQSNYIVDKVIDGETLQLNDGRLVRLIGVTVPHWDNLKKNHELAKQYKLDPNIVQLYSYASRNFVKEMVEGEVVVISFDSAF